MRSEAYRGCDFYCDYLQFFLDAIFVCAFAINRAISFLSNFNSHIVQNYLQMTSIIKQVLFNGVKPKKCLQKHN